MILTLKMIEDAKACLLANNVPERPRVLYISPTEYYDPVIKKKYEDMFHGVVINLAGRIK